MGYIYMIQNKINKKSYVGQTAQKPERRWKQHIQIALSDSPKLKCHQHAIHKAIKKYGLDNFEFTVLEEVDKNALNQREIYWIEKEDSYYHGYNETLGGEAVQKYDYDIIYQDYLTTYNLGETAINCSCSRDTVRTAVLIHGDTPKRVYKDYDHTHYRKYSYEEIAEKYKEFGTIKETAEFYGCDKKVVSKACRENGVQITPSGEKTREILGKPVKQIDLKSLSVIQVFPSASNAAQVVFNDREKSRNILACCEHRQKTAYGYGWSYVDEPIQSSIRVNDKKRSVVQKDAKTNAIVHIYESGIDAARAIGKGESAASVILKVCRNPKLKTAYGYKWEYYENT